VKPLVEQFLGQIGLKAAHQLEDRASGIRVRAAVTDKVRAKRFCNFLE